MSKIELLGEILADLWSKGLVETETEKSVFNLLLAEIRKEPEADAL